MQLTTEKFFQFVFFLMSFIAMSSIYLSFKFADAYLSGLYRSGDNFVIHCGKSRYCINYAIILSMIKAGCNTTHYQIPALWQLF